MKNKIQTTLLGFVAFILTACNSQDCDKSNWSPLFNNDLTNASYNKEVWSLDDKGVLTANKDEIIFTNKEYENFELELEFRLEHESNSGVVIYCTDSKNWVPNSIEIQIADSSSTRFGKPYWNCGCIFGHVDSEFDTRLPLGQWHKMKIRAVGQNIDVWLNGKHVSKMNMAEWTDNLKTPNGVKIPRWLTLHKKCDMPTKGKIGLQGKHGNAATDYRNVKIRSINSCSAK